MAVGLEGLFVGGDAVVWFFEIKKYGPEKFFGLNGMKHADRCNLG